MSETPTMVERVARAIADADMEDFMEDAGRYITRARAALTALREPTEAMLSKIHDKVWIDCRPDERSAYITNADEMWAAGIDAALASSEPIDGTPGAN